MKRVNVQGHSEGGVAQASVIVMFMAAEMAFIRYCASELFGWITTNMGTETSRGPPTMTGLFLVVAAEAWCVLALCACLGWLGFEVGDCAGPAAVGYAVSCSGRPFLGAFLALLAACVFSKGGTERLRERLWRRQRERLRR